MIKHVLSVKLKDNSLEECQKLKELFLSMMGKVPCIRDLKAGIDFLHSERSYDVILEVVLDNQAALEEYQKDPYHDGVVKPYVHQRREASIAVDYEMD